jgi:hypothetical protein
MFTSVLCPRRCVRVVADVGPPSRGAADAHVTATRMFTGSLDGHLKVRRMTPLSV